MFLSFSPTNAAELFLFESDGCEWCEAWDEEIGSTYHLTEVGKRAPIKRFDVDDPLPKGLQIFKTVVFSPTFVLVENGVEIGRIVGYIGEYQFWALLEGLIKKTPLSGKLKPEKEF